MAERDRGFGEYRIGRREKESISASAKYLGTCFDETSVPQACAQTVVLRRQKGIEKHRIKTMTIVKPTRRNKGRRRRTRSSSSSWPTPRRRRTGAWIRSVIQLSWLDPVFRCRRNCPCTMLLGVPSLARAVTSLDASTCHFRVDGHRRGLGDSVLGDSGIGG